MLSVLGVSKRFGPVRALHDVSMSLQAGEVLALCGENGAGKSTLVKILMGVHQCDTGTVELDGRVVEIRSPREGQALGIALVSQELSLAPDLSVEDNIWLGSAKVGLLHRSRALRRQAAAAVTTLGFDEPFLDRIVGSLTLAERQLVEIARNLCRDARVLILDEPTATLSDEDIVRLFTAIRGLSRKGCGVIYITHRLGEVFDICDRVVVLRNGEIAGSHATAAIDRDRLIEEMIGTRIENIYPPPVEVATAAPSLEVHDLTVPGVVHGASFGVKQGQIVGIAGQIGSGANEIVRALAGLNAEASAHLVFQGAALALGPCVAMRQAGLAFVTDDRATEGLFLNQTVRNNIVVSPAPKLSPFGVLNIPAFHAAAARAAQIVGIGTARLPDRVSVLSGGNQQKCVLARFVDHGGQVQSKLLLMNEPTRGVDVGARADLYRLLRDYCGRGFSVVMYSSDLEELLGMSDHIVTMYRGLQIATYRRAAVTVSQVLADITHASGASREAAGKAAS